MSFTAPKKPKRRNGASLDLIGVGKEQERKDSCIKHFKMRFRERHGGICRHHIYMDILKDVKAATPYKEGKEPNRFLYEIDHNGHDLHVVYDKKLKVLVTLLPPR